jgi:hypothetical protein
MRLAMAGLLLDGAQKHTQGGKVTPVNAGLPHPLGQAAVGQSQPLGHSCAAEPLTEAELYGLLSLVRRESAPDLGRVGHRWTV